MPYSTTGYKLLGFIKYYDLLINHLIINACSTATIENLVDY